MLLPRLSRAFSRPAVALTLALLAPGLAGLGGHPARAEEGLPDHASPSVCVVLIGLALQAGVIDEADEANYRSASDRYRKMSARLNGSKDAADQMIGSTVNFYAGLGEDELSEGADMCLESVDDRFTVDE